MLCVYSQQYSVEFTPAVDKDKAFTPPKVLESSDKPHLLRTYESCLFDKSASEIDAYYVIEITIHPYDEGVREMWNGSYFLNLQPIYADKKASPTLEDMLVLAIPVDRNEIVEMRRKTVKQHIDVVINKLKMGIQKEEGTVSKKGIKLRLILI